MKPVVVIDDDADVRDVLVYALETEGFDVLSFSNGKLGLEGLLNLAEDERPGLIIVDYLMPEMDGLTFINELKIHYSETLGKIPVAISSAMGNIDSELIEDSSLLRLHKPMDLDELFQMAKDNCA